MSRRQEFQCPWCLRYTDRQEQIGPVCAGCYSLWRVTTDQPSRKRKPPFIACRICKTPDT